METKRQRKENFSPAECRILIEEVELAQAVLFNKFSSTQKSKKWAEISEKINACGEDSVRSVPQVKKKWQDMKKNAKAKECAKRRCSKATGGGPPPRELSPMEEKIISIIPDLLIEGIPGGLDTYSMCLEEEVVEPIEADTAVMVPELPRPCIESAQINLQSNRRKETVKRKIVDDSADIVVEIEREKLELERKKLAVETERLAVEREKLTILTGISSSLNNLVNIGRILVGFDASVEPVITL